MNFTTNCPFFIDFRTNIHLRNIRNTLFNSTIVEVATKRQKLIFSFTSNKSVIATKILAFSFDLNNSLFALNDMVLTHTIHDKYMTNT